MRTELKRPSNEVIHWIIEKITTVLMFFFFTFPFVFVYLMDEWLNFGADMQSAMDEFVYLPLFLIGFLISMLITACLVGLFRFLVKVFLPAYFPYHYI